MNDINLEKIPKKLKERTQWVNWKLEKNENGKDTKVPYQPNGKYASVNDLSTWNSYEVSVQALQTKQFSGIGYVLSDDVVGIDIDACLGQDGKLKPWAMEILARFRKSYCELSPSGTGIHCLVYGSPIATGSRKFPELKEPGGIKDPGIEVYNTGRYFTVTGKSGEVLEIVSCQDDLDWLYDKYFAESYEEPKQVRNGHGELDLELIRTALSKIPADERGLWITIGFALKAAGIDFQVWNDWSSKSSKYNADECQKKWEGFRPGNIGIGTVFHHAKKYGFKFPSNDSSKKSTGHTSSGSAPNEPWSELLPLFRDISDGADFPIDALGSIISPAVKKATEVIQSAPFIAGYSALAAVNLTCQSHIDIVIDGRKFPASLYFLSIAPSGERKSATDDVFVKPLRDWEEQQYKRYKREYAEYKKEEENCQSLEPLSPILLCAEPTFEGLSRQLANGLPNLGLFTDEGARLLGGYAMSKEHRLATAGGLSSLWDRGSFSRLRASESATLHYGKRLAMHILVQPEISRLLLDDSELQAQGILARILPGSAVFTPKDDKEVDLSKNPAVLAYYKRVNEALGLSLPLATDCRNSLFPGEVRLSPKARNSYSIFHNEIQKRLAPGGKLESVRALAAKIHDHAARVAGTLSFFDQLEAIEISAEYYAQGIEIARFALYEAMRIKDASTIDHKLKEAGKLYNWLVSRAGERNSPFMSIAEIIQRGPGSVRSKDKAHSLLNILGRHGYARPSNQKVEYDDFSRPSWEVRLPNAE